MPGVESELPVLPLGTALKLEVAAQLERTTPTPAHHQPGGPELHIIVSTTITLCLHAMERRRVRATSSLMQSFKFTHSSVCRYMHMNGATNREIGEAGRSPQEVVAWYQDCKQLDGAWCFDDGARQPLGGREV